MNQIASNVGHNSGSIPISEILASDYEELAEKIAAALDEARALPADVENDEHVEAVTRVVKRVRTLATYAEDRRKAEKEPHLQAGRDVDAFFKVFNEKLEKTKQILERRVTAYLAKKAAEERARREEEERKAREEMERKMREAQEAESAKRSLDAEVALDSAAQAEQKADEYARAATAAVQDLARTKTEAGTAGLKKEWTFQIDDLSKVDLNALRQFIPQSAIEQALRAAIRVGVRQVGGVTIFETEKATFR